MSRRRNTSPPNLSAQTLAVAERLAGRLKTDIRNVRYVEMRYHDGRQWTLKAIWEHRVAEAWVEVDWTLLG